MRKAAPPRGDWFESDGKRLVGVVHLRPLPGSPRWGGDLDAVIAAAVADAQAYETGGADAVEIENFGDAPFTKGAVPPETVAAMAVAGAAARRAISIPLGFNVLRNDARAALGLCAACGGGFVRVNVLSGVMVTDQGLIEGDAFGTMRLRQAVAPAAKVFADVHVKHAAPLGAIPIGIAARDLIERALADALIVSGTGTGAAAEIEEVRQVRAACPKARILLGSGTTAESVANYLDAIDGVIVGTSVKRGGRIGNPVDERRVAALRRALDRK